MLDLTTPHDLFSCLEENPTERSVGAFEFEGQEGLALYETNVDTDGLPRVKVIARVLENTSAQDLLVSIQRQGPIDGLGYHADRRDWSLMGAP